MTKTTERKVAELAATTRRYLPLVPKGPFALSAAKYYPALKKLAAK